MSCVLELTAMKEEVVCGHSKSYDIFINCSWVVTRWQDTFTHKQYREQHK